MILNIGEKNFSAVIKITSFFKIVLNKAFAHVITLSHYMQGLQITQEHCLQNLQKIHLDMA